MAGDSGGGNGAVWVALIGLATTIAGGVFANWERIFPPPAPEVVMAAEPTAAGAPVDETTQAAAEPVADAASQETR